MSTENTPLCLWTPSDASKNASNLAKYQQWLAQEKKLNFESYDELWDWSVNFNSEFWQSLLDYFEINYSGKFEDVMTGSMPKTKWFEGIQLNYAEHVFRNSTPEYPAIIFKSENKEKSEISWKELEQKVACFQQYLISLGITEGDRVAAYLPNIPEAIIAFLAVAGLGAIWSSTSPDFGTSSVIDRIAQIKPKVFIAVSSYRYGGKQFDKSETISEILEAIPSISHIVFADEPKGSIATNETETILWKDIPTTTNHDIIFRRVEFSHPIWVLYSSGTTGLPKAITHSQGGILLEHLKYLKLHNDIKPGDRCFWYTTIGWMMWNYIQSSLLCQGTVVLYDGSPAYPDINVLWEYAEEAKINHFGISAGYVVANMKAKNSPGTDYNLEYLKSIGSTGSPLPDEAFTWIYKEVKPDIWLASISGGSDVCSAFVGGNPLLPVYRGEIQSRALGCSLHSFDASGNALLNKMGEMVITKPMPSMPIYFWGDENYEKYVDSYFSMYPGIWRHGDWTEVTAQGGVKIYGRSDSTLNRGGVRIGTAEIYRAVDTIPEVVDSMVIYLDKDELDFMPLFLKLQTESKLSEELIARIKKIIRTAFTPRHVPDKLLEVTDIPYTISGKKMETPIKRILMGAAPEDVINKDSMRNPEALDQYIEFAMKLKNT
jgi:acetoacetyl-CoA synthetase